MAYGKDDFVFDGLDDYDFSDFSDFSDDDTGRVSESDPSWSDSDDDIRQFCICGGPMTKEMIGCDGKNCAVEWWHYELRWDDGGDDS